MSFSWILTYLEGDKQQTLIETMHDYAHYTVNVSIDSDRTVNQLLGARNTSAGKQT